MKLTVEGDTVSRQEFLTGRIVGWRVLLIRSIDEHSVDGLRASSSVKLVASSIS